MHPLQSFVNILFRYPLLFQFNRQRPPAARAGKKQRLRAVAANGPRPLTYAERLELEGLEGLVEEADAKVAELEGRLADPDLYRARAAQVAELVAELDAARAEAARLMGRWEELEARAQEK